MRTDSRYQCEKCGTTMRDIEEARLSQFAKCKKCYKFAIEVWRFAVACAGDIAVQVLVDRLSQNER